MDKLTEILDMTLEQMGEKNGPVKLRLKMKNIATERDIPLTDAEVDHAFQLMFGEDENEELRHSLQQWIRRWDSVESNRSWVKGTEPHTDERRKVSYAALGLNEAQAKFVDARFPVATDDDPPIIIGGFEEHSAWYESRENEGSFYWRYYMEYLEKAKGWPQESIGSLDRSSRAVLARLRAPGDIAMCTDATSVSLGTRGLVVGYVQSGKTANFTAVIARAVDAGYRLIVVLGGTIEILRQQTVRRLDKELIGTDSVAENQKDLAQYERAEDFEEFVTYGPRLKQEGAVPFIRLSKYRTDYRTGEHAQLMPGYFAVEPEKMRSLRPVIVVIKKNSMVMDKLNTDLERAMIPLRNVPALIIDDESDQAGINTKDPATEAERTATNNELVRLLRVLPHSQYIGYTATPFANVFVNPDDLSDIFPRHYIVSLSRPEGYMGVADFYDLDSDGRLLQDIDRPEGMKSNKRAFYRAVDPRLKDAEAPAGAPPKLQQAVDSFVLAGAIKCFREARSGGDLRFRHHTMLVHTSAKQADHAQDAKWVRQFWENSNYGSGDALARLEELWTKDFRPVSEERWKTGLLTGDGRLNDEMFPDSFKNLEQYVAQCIQRINASVDHLKATIAERLKISASELEEGYDKYGGAAEVLPAVVVNSDREFSDLKLDFDRQPVWAMLCGGTKLSSTLR